MALARVLVTQPKALLLDEPLGDLDRLLQLRMRVELRNLQRELGLMFIHVTHNQEESLSMADRIVVMNDAKIQQIGDPLTIATKPETELVARFMGDNNIIKGTVARRDGRPPRGRRTAPSGRASVAPDDDRGVGDEIAVAVRAAAVSLDAADRGESEPQLGRLRDRLRRVPRRSREAPPHGRGRAAAGEGAGRAVRIPARARGRADPHLLEGGGCPAPQDLSDAPRLDVEEIEEAEEIEQPSEAALGEGGEQGAGWRAALWALPGAVWLGFFLIAPLVFIVLVSFWTYQTGAKFGFVTDWTLDNYREVFQDHVYWDNMWSSFYRSLIAVVACLVFGFPIAYFLALKVNSLRNQIALFIIALAPFWTSTLTRSIAWTFPLTGREGAINQIGDMIGWWGPDNPLIEPLSETSVLIAMIQLYILFMITPLFFTLSQVDRTAIEAARDLGGNWWRTFREVIVPQAMPGVVIGSIFVFVLTMGEYGTVKLVGGNAVTSVGTIVNSKVELAVQYPQGAASAVLLVIALIAGVFVITRFSNLREEL